MEPHVHGHAAAAVHHRGVALHVRHVTVDSSHRKQLHYAAYPERNVGQKPRALGEISLQDRAHPSPIQPHTRVGDQERRPSCHGAG